MSGLLQPPAIAQSPSTPQPPERRTLTILLDADMLGDLVGGLLEQELGDRFELRFLKFGSEAELRLQVLERPDLVFLYIGNVSWNPSPQGPPPQGCSKAPYARWVYTLGEISARFSVPIIAAQGTDLRADAERAGIFFLKTPFKSAAIISVVHAALGLDPSPDPAPAP